MREVSFRMFETMGWVYHADGRPYTKEEILAIKIPPLSNLKRSTDDAQDHST